jgi:hypothetical protein
MKFGTIFYLFIIVYTASSIVIEFSFLIDYLHKGFPLYIGEFAHVFILIIFLFLLVKKNKYSIFLLLLLSIFGIYNIVKFYYDLKSGYPTMEVSYRLFKLLCLEAAPAQLIVYFILIVYSIISIWKFNKMEITMEK